MPQGLDDDVDEAVVLALVVLQSLLAIGQLLVDHAAHQLAAHDKERRESFRRQAGLVGTPKGRGPWLGAERTLTSCLLGSTGAAEAL